MLVSRKNEIDDDHEKERTYAVCGRCPDDDCGTPRLAVDDPADEMAPGADDEGPDRRPQLGSHHLGCLRSYPRTRMTTRRFRARPSFVLLSASGLLMP